MDRYDPYTDKFLRDTQYDIPSTNLAEVGTDCISRQAAIDALNNMYQAAEKWRKRAKSDVVKTRAETCMSTVSEIKMRIWKLPSAQHEPKRGKWESQSGGGYCCSECGRYAMDKADGRIVMISIKSKFCPNCGADMREVTEWLD